MKRRRRNGEELVSAASKLSAFFIYLRCLPLSVTYFPCGSAGKESACNAGDLSLIPELGRSPGERKGYPLQYSCLESPMDRGAWWDIVHGVAKSWTD